MAKLDHIRGKKLRFSKSQEKTVRFAEDHDALLIEEIQELDADALWYTADDFCVLKLEGRLEAKEWRKDGLGVLLSETFENPRDETQEYLNAFCQLEDSRRGLERQLSREHGEERRELKDRARSCVISHQRRLQLRGQVWIDGDDEMSREYRAISHQAREFAVKMAKADEFVVREGVSDDGADAILIKHNVFVYRGLRTSQRRRSSLCSVESTRDSIRLPHFPSRRHRQGSCRSQSPAIGEDFFSAMSYLH